MEKSNLPLIAVTLFFLLGLGWWLAGREPAEKTGYTKEIKRLKMQNDSLVKENQLLDLRLEQLYLQNDSLTVLVGKKQERIKALKKEKHEKTKAIDNYSNDKLFRFFAGIDTDSTANKR